MAFAFGFPRDVTDLICSMRDWRWEMVKNGGKTPSASCFNEIPPHRGSMPITENMQPGRTYLQVCPNFSEWHGSGQYGIYAFVNMTRGEIPPHHRHRDFRIRPDSHANINVWTYNNHGAWSYSCWEIKQTFGPWSETRCPQPKSPAELWFQCEPATFNE